MLYSRKQQNIVKQLYSDKNKTGLRFLRICAYIFKEIFMCLSEYKYIPIYKLIKIYIYILKFFYMFK